jgi:hypothetical protein
MIEFLRRLVSALCDADATVTGVAALIGDLQPRTSDLSPWEVALRAPGVQSAEITDEGDGATPDYLRLELASDAGLTLAQLREAWGDAQTVPRSRPGQGARWAFTVRVPPSAATQCTVFCEMASGDTVRRLTLRRDPA